MGNYLNNLNDIIIFCIFLLTTTVQAQLQFCQGNSGDPIFTETFGTGIDYGPPLSPGITTYNFVGFDGPQDGQYTVGSNTFAYGWNMPSDHTPGDTDGKALIVNASFSPGEFYVTSISGLCETTTYEFSSWLMNILPDSGCGGNGIPVNVSFEIWDITDTNLLASGSTGDIFGSTTPNWQQYGLVFQTLPSQTEVILKMINNGVGGCGNDLAIDDISFSTCGDFIDVMDENNNTSITICENETPYDLNLTATPDFSVYNTHFYQWQESSDGISWADIVGEVNQSLNVLVSSPMFYRTKVAEDAINLGNNQCISISDVFEVMVSSSPLAPNSGGDMSINCNLNEANLTVSVPSGVTVNWYDSPSGGNLILSNNLIYIAQNEGQYYAEAINVNTGCISISRTELNAFIISPSPPNSIGDFGINCETNSAEISANTPNGIVINWYDAATDGNLLLASSDILEVTELGIYYAEAVDEMTGCKSNIRVPVSVLSELQSGNCIIPQGISPGVSPGLNDSFDLSGFEVSKLEIFNRYGTLVYSKTDYTNEWYGQTNNGDDLPVGTYFYTMDYQNGSRRCSWVYLNR